MHYVLPPTECQVPLHNTPDGSTLSTTAANLKSQVVSLQTAHSWANASGLAIIILQVLTFLNQKTKADNASIICCLDRKNRDLAAFF